MDRPLPTLPGQPAAQQAPRSDYDPSYQQQEPQQQFYSAQYESPEFFTFPALQQDNYRSGSAPQQPYQPSQPEQDQRRRPQQQQQQPPAQQRQQVQQWQAQQQAQQQRPQPQPQQGRPAQSEAQLQQTRTQDFQQQQDLARTQTRKSRSFSFGSHHSAGKSSISKKIVETSAEKEAKRLHSKADPLLAMQEAEPAQVAATVKSSLKSLRGFAYKDASGNPITEPDLSNPTRNKWERPLQTIQSFEAAIDGGYNRKSIYRSDSDSIAWGHQGGQRQSFYGGSMYGGNNTVGRFRPDSYYSRPPSQYLPRRESTMYEWGPPQGHGPPDGYGEPYYGNGYPAGPGPQGGRRGFGRMGSEPSVGPAYRRNPNEYTLPNGQRSQETVASASGGSGMSAEPAGYQTDPTSSDNSSIERERRRRQPPPIRTVSEQPVNDYGIAFKESFQAPRMAASPPDEKPSPMSSTPRLNGAASNGGTTTPTVRPAVVRKEVPSSAAHLRKAPVAVQVQASDASPPAQKRKSWLMRRFSKRA